jgi:hypothetical protein
MLVALVASLALVLIGSYAGGLREQANRQRYWSRRSTSIGSYCTAC